MTDLSIFNYDGASVRTILIDGEPWFVAADLCNVLSIQNVRPNLAKLDDDEKGVYSIDTLGGNQELAIVSEAGMYTLVLRSRKPEAQPFRKWVTNEVLPSMAKIVGINEAIAIWYIHQDCKIRFYRGESAHDGFVWCPYKIEEWLVLMPWISDRTCRRMLSGLEDKEILISSKPRAKQGDHSKSYRVNYCNLDASTIAQLHKDWSAP